MRLLYVGQLWEGSTTLERLRALERLGCGVVPFDVTPYLRTGSRVEQSVQSRFNVGRGIVWLNRALHATARGAAYDAVWVDKGVWLYPETLEALKNAACRRFAVHYTPDAQIVLNRSRHFLAALPSYDLLVTTKRYELSDYRSGGAREVLLVLQGFGTRFSPCTPSREDRIALASDVCFIGHQEAHYAARVRAASQVGCTVAIWGPRWPRCARFNRWARGLVRGDGIWGDRYPLALASSKIALGLLSKWIPETTTTRTFEIPASGVFMLAERTEDHLALFEEGREAEFFGGDEELQDKIRFYLANDDARDRIARAGRDRCLRSGYSDAHQLRGVLTHMARLAGNPVPTEPRA